MDAFSDILSSVRLNGAFYFHARFSAPWGASTPPAREIASILSPGSEHLLIYHLVVEGTASAQLEGHSDLPLAPGDVVIFPHGDSHIIAHDSGCDCVDAGTLKAEILRKVVGRDMSPLEAGGGGSLTRFVCGYMACDPHMGRPILSGLPPMFKVNVRTDRSGQWLESSIMHLVDEAASGSVGSEAMLTKLSEALFVDTLRRFVASLPEEQTGWLAGARDPVVGKSLALLHERVKHPWTIADLASEVGLSRTTLVERFTRYLSEPPMAYLTRWRLQLAARSLARTSKAVAAIGTEVGYESEAAFTRAFKRMFGQPPAQYRREQRNGAAR